MRLEGVDKKPIARVVSRSAARFRLIHVLVRNEGCEPFQWHHNGLHEVRPPNSDRFFVTQLIGRISKDPKDLKGFYSISTASFVVWIDFSAHNYLETFQDLRLGFPKRPYF